MPDPVINYYSIASYLATGQDHDYIIPYPFLRQEDIYVYVNGTQISQSNLAWITQSQFQITSTILENDVVVVRRYTKQDLRLADYNNSSILTGHDLNIVTKQLLYLIQENTDYRTAGLDPNPPPGQVPPNDDGGPSLIDDIIAQIIGTQLFQNLIELIQLTDINAEAIIANSLATHSNWSVNRLLDSIVDEHTIRLDDYGITLDTIDAQIIDINNTIITDEGATAEALAGIAVRFEDAEANILTLQTAFVDSEEASATLTQQLQANISANSALILSVETASTNSDEALTSRINVMESDFNSDIVDVNARIGTVEQTYVSDAEANALIQTEITLWYGSNDFEPLFASSSYISGINSTVTEQSSEITGIQSFLVGTNADYNDPSTWDSGTLAVSFAGLQETVSVQSDAISANSNLRTSLFSAFYPNGDNTDNTGMVAAMEQTWRTYTDEESALATRTTSLEANQQPIFFRGTPPDPRSQEFQGTRFADGFPRGSLWHDTRTNTRIITYFWHTSNSPPSGLIPGEYYTFGGITGMWAKMIDEDLETQGASIQTLESAYSNLTAVGGIIEQTIQATVGADIAAISQTMESWFDPETGQMYSGWQVRINQYNDGTPTIAGVGLGMENDPDNPEAGSVSNFIVMADRFSVVRPPTASDLAGGLDPSNVFIPFIVNSGNVPGEPDVIVNGSLFAKNTFSTNDGYAGRFTFTDLDGNGYPVERDGNFVATGSRLVMASDTNNYNSSNGPSPFPGGSNPQKFWMWAGSGTMNHNNAVFYVDTDGNAFYGGSVLADNITGDISNVHSVAESGSVVTVPNNSSGWFTVRTSAILSPSGSRTRTPSVIMNINMYGEGSQAGRGKIQGRTVNGTVFGPWQDIAEAAIATPTGTTLTLAGSMGPTTGSIQIRSQIKREETGSGWQYPSSNELSGIVTLLS